MKYKTPVILQILPDMHSGGVERGTCDIGKFLVRSGCRSLVVSAGGRMVRTLHDSGVVHMHMPCNSKNPITMYNNVDRIVKIIKEHGVDIVHVRSRAPAWSALRAAHLTKCPIVSTFHGYYEHDNMLQRTYNGGILKTDHVIAVSDFIRQHILNVYQLPEEKVTTIHRGVDLQFFNPNNVEHDDIASVWHMLGYKDNIPVILLPGRIARSKGHLLLLRALGKITHKDFYCLFVGKYNKDDAYVREINDMITELGLGQQVKIIDHINNMPVLYMCADIVVAPSCGPIVEPFGRVSIEAQAMKKAIIASNMGGYKETITHDQTGWLFEDGDHEHLSELLERTMDMGIEQKVKLGEQARRNVVERFSSDKMCNQTLEIYQKIAKIKLFGS